MNTTYDEYQELCQSIAHHNLLYFQKAQPEITDEEFDALVRKVESIEKEHPDWIGESSPSRQMGEAPLAGFSEVTHAVPMLSLEKAFSVEEIQAFMDRARKLLDGKEIGFTSEIKMDGLALSVLYEHGTLKQAVTRGDGKVGSDVTANVKMIQGVPHHIKGAPSLLEVRGEVYLPYEDFAELNREREQKGDPLWANPRNAAAGTLKLLDPKQVAARKGIQVAFYGIARSSEKVVQYQHEIVPYLESVGLPTVATYLRKHMSRVVDVVCPNTVFTTASSLVENALKLQQIREKLPFGIDGAVFKLDNLSDADKLSVTAKHPRSAIAFKFSAEQAWTTIRDITVQVGRTGVLTPVAELEPTLLAGSTISRATLHNEEEIQRKDIRVFDRVVIEKGGDVIPKVVSVDFSARTNASVPWKMKDECPVCGTKVVRDESEVAVRCPNTHCPEQVIRGLVHFSGKSGLDIEGLGDKVVRHLYAKGFIRTPADIFNLQPDQICQVEGFKEKSTENLYHAIQKAKHTTLSRLILALGIRHVGVTTAELIARKVESLEGLKALTQDDLLEIHGIGEKVAESVSSYVKDPQNITMFDDFVRAGLVLESTQIIQSSISGLQIVLTGTLSTMTRGDATKLIKERGGIVSESVSKKTNLVVAGSDAGSKLQKAEKLGVKVITEQEFQKLLQL